MDKPRNLFLRLFISPSERRLRAGWRLLVHLVLLQAMTIAAALPLLLAQLPPSPLPGSEWLPTQAAALAGVTLSVFLCRRWLDRRSISSLGLQIERKSWLDLLAGFLIAGLMMLLIFLVERTTGWLTVGSPGARQGVGQAVGLLAMLVAFIASSWQEELYFRGYLLQNLRDGLNLAWAIGLSSVLFSLAHLLNPNASLMGMLGILLAGLFMAYAWLRSGRLWLPLGLHVGWNFFEGPVFGFPVSGLETFRLLPTQVNGPELLTGGAFGPEAGLLLLPALALGMLCIFYYTK